MSRNISKNFHIVVSTKELQSIEDLSVWLNTYKNTNNHIVSVEKGMNGHEHLDAYVMLSKETRQDKFREAMIKALYSDIPKEQQMNIKVTVNTIDPDPRYAIGYTMKENPERYYTTFSEQEIQASKEYYQKYHEEVKQKIVAMKTKTKELTLDSVVDDYVTWLVQQGCKSLYTNIGSTNGFINKRIEERHDFSVFYKTYYDIPYSLYKKIHKESFYEYVAMCVEKRAQLS